MADMGKICIECGRSVELFSWATIDGNAYHSVCWESTRRARSTRETKAVEPKPGPDTKGP
jgi:predicted Fe-S protein YdhL (DUF1289 family)